MTNATLRAHAQVMPIDRRAALGFIIAAGAMLAAPRIAKAADMEADPVFAAIEHYRAARERFGDAVNITDEVLARQQGRVITAADEAEYRTASDAEVSGFLTVLSTPPQTKAGARAMREYVSQFDLDMEIGEAALPALLGALLRSPLIAGG